MIRNYYNGMLFRENCVFARTSFCRLINNPCRTSIFQQCKLFFLFSLFSPFFRRNCSANNMRNALNPLPLVFFLIFLIFSSSKRSIKKKKNNQKLKILETIFFKFLTKRYPSISLIILE